MPDSPDYSKTLPQSNRFPLADFGEMAVRLGSPVFYDRRGEVIYYTTFANGINPEVVSFTGSNGYAGLDVGGINNDGFCLRLSPGTTSTKLASLSDEIGGQPGTRFGLEIGLSLPESLASIAFVLSINDGSNVFQFSCRYVYTGQLFQIYDNVLGWTTIYSGVDITSAAKRYYNLKIVVDINEQIYSRVLFGMRQKNITQYSPVISGTTDNPSIRFAITATGDAVPDQHCYFSHIIITSNEP